MRAITIRQPWAWAVIHAGKTVENRSRNIAGGYRGPVAIHASKRDDLSAFIASNVLCEAVERYLPRRTRGGLVDMREPWLLNHGMIIGVADLVDVHYVDGHSERWDAEAERNTTCSPWAHHGPIWHLVFTNPRPLAHPIPARGQLGLWTLPDDVEQEIPTRVRTV